jgi:hypothetical protein
VGRTIGEVNAILAARLRNLRKSMDSDQQPASEEHEAAMQSAMVRIFPDNMAVQSPEWERLTKTMAELNLELSKGKPSTTIPAARSLLARLKALQAASGHVRSTRKRAPQAHRLGMRPSGVGRPLARKRQREGLRKESRGSVQELRWRIAKAGFRWHSVGQARKQLHTMLLVCASDASASAGMHGNEADHLRCSLQRCSKQDRKCKRSRGAASLFDRAPPRAGSIKDSTGSPREERRTHAHQRGGGDAATHGELTMQLLQGERSYTERAPRQAGPAPPPPR